MVQMQLPQLASLVFWMLEPLELLASGTATPRADLHASYDGLYGQICPPDFFIHLADENSAAHAQWGQFLTECLQEVFPSSSEMAKSRVFAPISMARTLFEIIQDPSSRAQMQDELFHEAAVLTDAVFDVVCLNAYLPCLKQVTAGPQSSNWPLLQMATLGIKKACAVIDEVLSDVVPEYVSPPNPPLSRSAKDGEDGAEEEISLQLHCGGYFVHPVLFRYLLQEYRLRLPRRPPSLREQAENGGVLVEVLLALTETSRYIVNIGAGLVNPADAGDCALDPADCLCHFHTERYKCILMEGDPVRSDELRKRYQKRHRVRVFSEYVYPNTVLEVVQQEAQALESFESEGLTGSQGSDGSKSPWKGKYFPDLLKLDIDNGDCQFLEALLEQVRPIMINVEVWQYVLPPTFAYSRYFDASFTNSTVHQYRDIFRNMLRGCSLGEILRIVRDEYRIFHLDKDERVVHMIHRDFLGRLPPASRGTMNLMEQWERVFFRPESIYHEDMLMGYAFPVRSRLISGSNASGLGSSENFEGLLEYLTTYYRFAHYWANGRDPAYLDWQMQRQLWHLGPTLQNVVQMHHYLEHYTV